VAGSPSFLAWIADETRLRDPDLPPGLDDADAAGEPDVPRPRAAGLPSPSDLPG